MNSPTIYLLPEQINTQGGNFSLSRNGDLTFETTIDTDGGNFNLATTGALVVFNPITTNGGSITLAGNTIDTRLTTLDSRSVTSNGGTINLSATEDIFTGNIRSNAIGEATVGTGGNILLNSEAGRIDTTSGELVTGGSSGNNSSTGNAGRIEMSAQGSISSDTLSTYSAGSGRGGRVNLTSGAGSITAETIDAGSSNGDGGAIRLNANRNITVTDLLYSGSGSLADPDLTLGNGEGGRIALSTNGNITLNEVGFGSSSGQLSQRGLLIDTAGIVNLAGSTITSNGARIDIGNTTPPNNVLLPSGTFNTNGGNFNIFRRTGNLTFSNTVDTDGGNFNLTSNGALNLTNPITTNGGAITLRGDRITTDLLDSSSSAGGGAITLSAQGDIFTADLISNGLGGEGSDQAGGAIRLTAENGLIETGDVNSSGSVGGNIIFDAEQSIAAGEINSSSSTGDGGDVTLDPEGDVEVTFINAQGGDDGQGGGINIVAGEDFRATGSFLDRNGDRVSISSAGGQGGGDITIRHGGRFLVPFNVGDLEENGTTAAISSGESAIRPTESFRFPVIEGNIQILTDASPVSPNDFEEPVPESPPPSSTELDPPRVISPQVPNLEESFTDDFVDYLNVDNVPVKSLVEIQQELAIIETATRTKPALLYTFFAPATDNPENPETQVRRSGVARLGDDTLRLVLITSTGDPIVRSLGVTRREVEAIADSFRNVLQDDRTPEADYIEQAKKLYQWLILPVEDALTNLGVDNIAFIPDVKLRSLPFAALYDEEDPNGNHYLIQKYSIGLIPSFSLRASL